jgi:hypothetical protein
VAAPTERMTAEEIEAMRVHALGYSGPFTPTFQRLAMHVERLVAELRAVAAERDEARMTLASLTTDDGGS